MQNVISYQRVSQGTVHEWCTVFLNHSCALEAIAGQIGAIAEMQAIFCIFVVFAYISWFARQLWCHIGQTLCTTVVHQELPCCYMCLKVVPVLSCCAITEPSCKSKTYTGFIQWHRNQGFRQFRTGGRKWGNTTHQSDNNVEKASKLLATEGP